MIMISSKGRYALAVMTYLAVNARPGFVPLKEIAGSGEYFSEVS